MGGARAVACPPKAAEDPKPADTSQPVSRETGLNGGNLSVHTVQIFC